MPFDSLSSFQETNQSDAYIQYGYTVHHNLQLEGIKNLTFYTKKDIAIAISLVDGNIKKYFLMNCILDSYQKPLRLSADICRLTKQFYHDDFSCYFPVSTQSMAMELILHLIPDSLSKIGTFLPNETVKNLFQTLHTHTRYADIGLQDELRNYDDLLVKLYQRLIKKA